MMQRQRAFRAMDAATKARNAWVKFTAAELEIKLTELRRLVNSGTLTDSPLEHQFAEIAIINELAGLRSGEVVSQSDASDLLGVAEIKSPAEMEEQANAILEFGPGTVLLKGGHIAGGHSPDLLAKPQGLVWLDGPRDPTRNTHGTGCALSAALATQLAHGYPLPEAARITKHFVSEAIRAADDLDVSRGSGPVHHFHALCSKTAG
jgi:hydroxymethylpyrimidine/phosphomethylpyrimidine kinase